MKLLFDENLSRRLVPRVLDLFPESLHVSAAGLLEAQDDEIWEFARTNNFTIITADSDFYEISTIKGPPPKVIWLRDCDYPTAIAERLIRNQAVRIADFERDAEQSVLVLQR